jgi:hypothetical protein
MKYPIGRTERRSSAVLLYIKNAGTIFYTHIYTNSVCFVSHCYHYQFIETERSQVQVIAIIFFSKHCILENSHFPITRHVLVL